MKWLWFEVQLINYRALIQRSHEFTANTKGDYLGKHRADTHTLKRSVMNAFAEGAATAQVASWKILTSSLNRMIPQLSRRKFQDELRDPTEQSSNSLALSIEQL